MENTAITSWTSLRLSTASTKLLAQYYQTALQTGEHTACYVRQVIEHGRIETTLVQGCRAIIRLSRVFGAARLEAACARALQGNKYNYNTIKNILINHLDEQGPVDPAADMDAIEDHENLRGWPFFDKTKTTQS